MKKIELLRAVTDACTRAHDLYDCRLSDYGVKIKLEKHMGCTAGQFRCHRDSDGKVVMAELRFNIKAALLNPEDMLKDTIPHEVAHAIHWFKNQGRGHDSIWRKICVELGGSGNTYHSLQLKPRHAQKRWLYVASCGTEARLTTTIHKKVQAGQHRILRATRGRITADGYKGPVK